MIIHVSEGPEMHIPGFKQGLASNIRDFWGLKKSITVTRGGVNVRYAGAFRRKAAKFMKEMWFHFGKESVVSQIEITMKDNRKPLGQ